jgi:hypothetical protein
MQPRWQPGWNRSDQGRGFLSIQMEIDENVRKCSESKSIDTFETRARGLQNNRGLKMNPSSLLPRHCHHVKNTLLRCFFSTGW